MKTKTLVLSLCGSLMLCLVQVAYGQAYFSFDIDDTNGHQNYTGVGASGGVNFDTDSGGDWTSEVKLMNDSTVSSSIVGFYILKPFILNPETPDDSAPNSSDTLFTATDVVTDGLATQWSLADGSTVTGNDKFGETLNEFYDKAGKDYQYLFFGAQTQHVNDGLNNFSQMNPIATFTFEMNDLSGVDWDDYMAADAPHIFIRWREVNNGDSAKGYDTFDHLDDPFEFDPSVVPEPSEVALMAMLGLGGLLYARRRFVKK